MPCFSHSSPHMEAKRILEHTSVHKVWFIPRILVACSFQAPCRRFIISWFCCTSLVSRTVSSPLPLKPAYYLSGSAWDWELPEQGLEKDTTSWQNTETYFSHNRVRCTVSTVQEKRKLIFISLISFRDNQCVPCTNRNDALQTDSNFQNKQPT